MPWIHQHCRDANKKKLADARETKKLDFELGKNETGEFAPAYMKVCALLRFYFSMTRNEIDAMDEEEFVENYMMLRYAMDFDAARANNDGKKKIYWPL